MGYPYFLIVGEIKSCRKHPPLQTRKLKKIKKLNNFPPTTLYNIEYNLYSLHQIVDTRISGKFRLEQ